MFWYDQRTGRIFHNKTFLAMGYSGKDAGKNNPQSEDVRNVGPIPAGVYKIGPAADTASHGPLVLPLYSMPENEMYGRCGFLIHGDSIDNPGQASEGCIILDHETRTYISKAPDKLLVVM